MKISGLLITTALATIVGAAGASAKVTISSAVIKSGKLIVTGKSTTGNERYPGRAVTTVPIKPDNTFKFVTIYRPTTCKVRVSVVGNASQFRDALVANCGPYGLVPRGAWSPSNSYAVNDLVTDAGSSWRAKVAVAVGGLNPSDGPTWELFAASGDANGPQGPQGTQGTQGATGPQGADGAQGTAGAQGTQGATGTQGAEGAQGATGAAGGVGPQGATGGTGSQGATGGAGPQGATGGAGPQGATGGTGPQGTQGTTGAVGGVGPQGAAGGVGPQGATGGTGAQGTQGTTGAAGGTGPQGATGGTGPQGTQGTTGASRWRWTAGCDWRCRASRQ